MKSDCFINRNICTLSLAPSDIKNHSVSKEILDIAIKNNISDVIINLSRFEIITSELINYVSKLVNILKLNNISSIVCGINEYSASIIFHFVDEINFPTTLDVQSALNVINNK